MKAVFSDLDGTILDFYTYSYENALEGINILKEQNIHLIPISSKTLPEMKQIIKELQLSCPFAFENGGGIAFPKHGNKPAFDYRIEIVGLGIAELEEKLDMFREIIRSPISTLFEMDIEEIVEKTKLPHKSIMLIKKRESSIPFITSDPDTFINLDESNIVLEKHDLKITKGGRFYHLSSKNTGKGNAVNKIIDYLKKTYNVDNITSVGIGDSENDIPMLNVVDIPVLVRKPDNSIIDVKMNVMKTEKIGPSGFTEAMKSIFL